jgi:hypothetical protein
VPYRRFRASVFIAVTAWTAGTGDPVNHHFINHLKQTKLQKDARYQVNRSHNRRCSGHR